MGDTAIRNQRLLGRACPRCYDDLEWKAWEALRRQQKRERNGLADPKRKGQRRSACSRTLTTQATIQTLRAK